MKRYGIIACMSFSAAIHAQFDFAQGDEPTFIQERVPQQEEPIVEPSRSGHQELTFQYMKEARQEAQAKAERAEREAARYRDMPTREEAQAEGESYWSHRKALAEAQKERRLEIERSTRAQKLSQQYYGRTPEVIAEELEADRTAREEKEAAFAQYYSELAARERAYEEAKYEQKFQEFEQQATQAYEEAQRTVEQEKRAAQALDNILRSAKIQEQIEEQTAQQLAQAAEKTAQTAAFLENLMQMSKSQAETMERSAERASRIEETRRIEQEWERAYQAARESEVAVQRIIRSAWYQEQFDDAIKRDIERTEQQLAQARLKIKKKAEVLRLQVQFEEASAKFNEEWQRAQDEINKSYAKRAVEQLERLKHTIHNLKKDVLDPALQQAADGIAHAVVSVSQAVNQNREWKEQAQQAAAKAQVWMNQARAWVSAQTGFLEKLPSMPRGEFAWMGTPGYVPARMQGTSYKGEGYAPGLRMKASEWARIYRKAVKDFDNRKKLKGTPEYENFLQALMNTFEVIKSALQADPDLKRAVTTSVIPLLVRRFKSEDVIIQYIDSYLKKLENELATYQLRKQFGPQST